MRPSAACLFAAACTLTASQGDAAFTRNILITGYWPPTNEMLRPWSTNPVQNPGGWQGLDWEGRGYNIYSYFPEFPGGVEVNPRGTGDFQVDYQAASADFWRITSELNPLAIITFSRGSAGSSWELESRARKLPLNQWTQDYLAPFQPTADLPIASEPDGTIRFSSLPMTQIRNAVAAANLGVNAFIDTSNSFGGTFVSEFTSYHSAWYANLHASPADPFQAFAGGHIHVGINTPLAAASQATRITLRELTTYLDSVIPAPGGLTLAALAFLPFARRRR
jgi:hypothetical protein